MTESFEAPQRRQPSRVARVAVAVILACLACLAIIAIRQVVATSSADPARCEELTLGHMEGILVRAKSSTDFSAQLKAGGAAAQLYPECRGLSAEQAKTVSDRVTARMMPLITAQALVWQK
jgi:hypothetical protein